MALPKPTKKPEWTDGVPAKVLEPSAGKKLLGWVFQEAPPFEWMNWLFYTLDEWVDYLESITDELALPSREYDAITGAGAGATHADLTAVLADGGIGSNAKVLCTVPEVLTATIDLTKSGMHIVFTPAAIFSDGGAGTGLKVSADRVTLENGRFTGFTKAIEIAVGSDYTWVKGSRFASNTTEIDDLASTSQLNVMVE
jgi:hypothetical protein